MNWLDILVIALVVIGGVIGWRMGLVQAVVTIIGVIVATVVGARASGPVADFFTSTVGSASIAAVAAYVIVGVIVFAACQLIGYILTKFLKLVFLGQVNSLGGLFFGLVAGFLAGAVIVAVLARLAFMVPHTPIENGTTVQVRQGLKDNLLHSATVPAYINLYDSTPVHTIGMTTGDFHAAIQELKAARDAQPG